MLSIIFAPPHSGRMEIIMKKTIDTVLGEINCNDVGDILFHEHVTCHTNAMRETFGDKWFNKNEVIDTAVRLFKNLKNDYGVNTVVDATPNNLGRDMDTLRKVSERSGVNIIFSSGIYYTEDFFLRRKSPELIASFIIDECKNGVSDYGVKPGFLKCATSERGITEINEKILHAMALAQIETGLPLFSHNSVIEDTPFEQVKLFDRYGVDLSKTVIGHAGDRDDLEYLTKLAKTGCCIGFDRLYSGCENRIRMIYSLIERGFEDRILLSHDASVFIDCCDYTWDEYKKTINENDSRYTTVHKEVLPALRLMGVPEGIVKKLVYNNPLKLLQKE